MEEVKPYFEEVTEEKLHSLLSHIEMENGRESFTIDPNDPNGTNKATLTLKDIWPKGVYWSVWYWNLRFQFKRKLSGKCWTVSIAHDVKITSLNFYCNDTCQVYVHKKNQYFYRVII